MVDVWSVSLFVVLFSTSLGILLQFQATQPKPYLDEVFHIPQAQKYCQYRFGEWDPMITTLPGLYFVSFFLLRVATFFTRIKLSLLCSVFWLRFTNILFMIGNAWLLQKLLLKIHSQEKVQNSKVDSKSSKGERIGSSDAACTFSAINISIFPVLYFFTFLYYTDVGSTFFVLLMYLLSLHDQHTLAAIAGVASIIFRQTNVIWVTFVAGTTAVRILHPQVTNDSKDDKNIPELYYFIQSFFKNIILMISTLYMYGLVVVCFVGFVIMNKGIVVGDRSSHEACLNIPQLFYFLAFTLFFSSPLLLLLDNVVEFLTFLKKTLSKPIQMAAFFLASLIVVFLICKFTYVHKYLLADNRHYPFYIWRKVYARHWSVRYLLIPLYFYAARAIYNKLSVKQSSTWQLIFWICVTMLIVPQKLFEFRYFILPYVIYRIHVPIVSNTRMVLEFSLNLVINTLTIYVFLKKPFYWSHEPTEVQRFMW